MAVFVKQLTGLIPHFELVFFRAFINLIPVLAIVLYRREKLFPPGTGILTIRGLAGFGGLCCVFYAMAHLPLSIAVMLLWCSPIFVILFSWLFLREKLHPWQLVAVAIAFVGLILLLRPDWSGARSLPIGATIIGLFGAVFSGLAYVAVRAATARVGVNLIVLYFVAISTILSAPLAVRNFYLPNPREAIRLLIIGVLATASQFTMTQAYRYAPAGQVSTMGLMNAAFSALFGWVLFDERLAGLQWLGMGLLSAGVAFLSLGGKNLAHRGKTPLGTG